MIWGWLGICAVSLCVAYSMAEMCSEYPVAGGQYSWVYILSPKSIRRQFSYMTGWFMIIGKFGLMRQGKYKKIVTDSWVYRYFGNG